MKVTVNQFIEEIKNVIKRDGVDDLINYITSETDFFKAPASSEHHLACEGGLLEHSWNVYQALKNIAGKYTPDIPLESIAITGMFHDLCKANFYKNDFRNRKINGKWEQVPYYSIEDKDPFGHGEKSVIILQQHIKLTKEEILAIRYHMGAWSAEGYIQQKALGSAIDQSKFLRATMLADQVATYFMED